MFCEFDQPALPVDLDVPERSGLEAPSRSARVSAGRQGEVPSGLK